jgi:hypothetical protein
MKESEWSTEPLFLPANGMAVAKNSVIHLPLYKFINVSPFVLNPWRNRHVSSAQIIFAAEKKRRRSAMIHRWFAARQRQQELAMRMWRHSWEASKRIANAARCQQIKRRLSEERDIPAELDCLKGGGAWRLNPRQQADWICPGCGVNCFASRTECFKCGSGKPGDSGGHGRRGAGMKERQNGGRAIPAELEHLKGGGACLLGG